MRAENPAALRFILQDDIYLLPNDKTLTNHTVIQSIAVDFPEPVITAPIEPVTEPPVIQFDYLGKNKKQFLIVTHYPDQEFIADAHLTALQNILERKSLDIDDVAIFNVAKNEVADEGELFNYFSPKKLLILGKQALPQKMEAPALNELKQLSNYTALYSFSFDEMMDSTENKKAFWGQMKNL